LDLECFNPPRPEGNAAEEVEGDDFVDLDERLGDDGSSYDGREVSGDGTYFTQDFYVAMGLILLFLAILGFFSWLWLRGPKNKWEK